MLDVQKKFAGYQILKAHKLGHTHKCYNCDICSHDYASNFSLPQHINVKHKGLKYIKKCSKGFMKDHFKVHVNQHNQISPFQCDN